MALKTALPWSEPHGAGTQRSGVWMFGTPVTIAPSPGLLQPLEQQQLLDPSAPGPRELQAASGSSGLPLGREAAGGPVMLHTIANKWGNWCCLAICCSTLEGCGTGKSFVRSYNIIITTI